MASTGGTVLAECQFPKRSSPVTVAKSLFCELEEPTEDVFEDGAKGSPHSSFTSPLAGSSNVCISLSLDSDGSCHETSLTVDSDASRKLSRSSDRDSASSEEQEEVSNSPTTESRPKTPPAVFTETPTFGSLGQRGESQSCFLNQLPDPADSVTQSPSFLRLRNVVVFRSYCSSINRSNMSRLSIRSVEAMDMSAGSSYQSASCNATPVQKRSSSSKSLSQVGQSRFFSNSYSVLSTCKIHSV